MERSWPERAHLPVRFLESFSGDRRSTWRTQVRSLPFSIGRSGECDLLLASGKVSQRHAVIEAATDGEIHLRDLGSTNGTFLNGERVLDEARGLRHGDILHFADEEFRLVATVAESPESLADSSSPTQVVSRDAVPAGLFAQIRRLQRVFDDASAIVAYFQPIVSFEDPTKVLGAEVLGRGILDGDVIPPGELFSVAVPLGREAHLSRAFRLAALRDVPMLPQGQHLFLNTHPAEIQAPDTLLRDLEAWREKDPERPAVLEIHEGAVADLGVFMKLTRRIRALDVGIAFDDFGRGQARLLEIVDVEPDWVKFDRAWLENLHRATPGRWTMIEKMVRIVLDLGIATIAEGVELEDEAAVCRDLGFQWAQGYLYGRPGPLG